MCGLVAVLNLDGRPAELPLLKRMTDLIRHRGPDDDGFYTAGPLGFGFRRLSVLDLSPAGHQPMTLAEAGLTIVFNGEIYNYLELRAELEALGHRFHSTGDTEVLLHAYQQWGHACLPRLNGMWAFLVHDRRTGQVFGARDRFGIKPLYRYQDKQHIMFASEIKAIRDSGRYHGGTNWEIAANFLVRGALDNSNASFYQGIASVGAGCAFELGQDGSYREWTYWSVEQVAARTVADPAAEYAELFEDAVRLHMRSDVPVAVHLSGGLDSSAILCAAARVRQAAGARDPLLSFCFQDRDFDEHQYIEANLAQTGSQMELLQTSPRQLWDDLPRVLWHQDEPVHTFTACVSYQLMRQTAARGVKVVLNGQGADETAAGYPSFVSNYWHSLLRAGQPLRMWSEIRAHAQWHGGDPAARLRDQLALGARSALALLPPYRYMAEQRARQRVAASPWLQDEFSRHATPRVVTGQDQRLPAALVDAMRRAPLPVFLRVEDRNSSAHSLEGRLPFLDYRLVELLFQLPDHWRMRGYWNKYVQREGMRGRIPELVRTRVDKMGFPVPTRRWLTGELYEDVRDLLSSQATRERGLYNVPALLRALDSAKSNTNVALAAPLFQVAEFELWCRQASSSVTADTAECAVAA
ncbi:asparagine synthase (glutamine-hydrolyzing) [Pseudoduganella sp.]|uniref:asparagine synthase (glutamine-hydrolyzing) n=1 Tax=Pseudoduganella sp. TaxID=1880898 RepID=UPI0035B17EFC